MPGKDGIPTSLSPIKIPSSAECTKAMELEDLKNQLHMEKEFTRRFEQLFQQQQVSRGPPPDFHTTNPHTASHRQHLDHTTGFTPQYHQNSFQRNPWQNYARYYEQDTRNQFLKSITKGPRLDFPRFDGDNPEEWIRQCEKCFQMSATPDEFKLQMAQLYITGRADKWLRRSGLLKCMPT